MDWAAKASSVLTQTDDSFSDPGNDGDHSAHCSGLRVEDVIALANPVVGFWSGSASIRGFWGEGLGMGPWLTLW